MYYNSTNLRNPELFDSVVKAKHQDEIILDYFKNHPGAYSPEYIHETLFTSKTPLTSVRRAFNTLESGLFIEKTGEMKMGNFGKMVNTWRVKK